MGQWLLSDKKIIIYTVKKYLFNSSRRHVVFGTDVFHSLVVDCVWNVMAHAQKPHFVFRRNGRVHLNRRGLQFSRLLAAEGCASAVVMLDTPCSEVVWRALATHSIRQFSLHFPSHASPCAITFKLQSTAGLEWWGARWITGLHNRRNNNAQISVLMRLYNDLRSSGTLRSA
jgi:hypothetical protein